MDKRGLSEVVTTIITILLSLVAIGAIWVVVQNVILDSSDSIGIEQFSLDVDFQKASLDGNDVILTVKRNKGVGNLTGLKFIVSDGLNSEEFTEMTSLNELDIKTFTVTLVSLVPTNIELVSVAPIYNKDNGEETLGDVTDTIAFTFFSVGGGGTGDGGGDGGGEIPAVCEPACTGEDTCVNGVCVPPNCVPDDDSLTCGAWICGIKVNNCGQLVDCATIGGGCSSREECDVDFGTCSAITPISGIINSVWPTGVATYFDSYDLPNETGDNYAGYWTEFLAPSLESECLQISHYDVPVSPQTTVQVKLTATQTSASAGDSIRLWPTSAACLNI